MNIYYLMGFQSPPNLGPLQELSREKDLHVTLMPAFTLEEQSLDLFLSAASAAVEPFAPIICHAKEEAFFGTDREEIPVVLYDKDRGGSHSLSALHLTLSEILFACNGQYFDPYVLEHYTPHSSYGDVKASPLIETLTLVVHRGGFGLAMEALAHFKLLGK